MYTNKSKLVSKYISSRQDLNSSQPPKGIDFTSSLSITKTTSNVGLCPSGLARRELSLLATLVPTCINPSTAPAENLHFRCSRILSKSANRGGQTLLSLFLKMD